MELDNRLPTSAEPFWTCAEFQKAEDDMLEIYSKTVDFGADQSIAGDMLIPTDKESMCKGMYGSRVFVQTNGSWIDPWGRNIAGITYCPYGNILVGLGSPHRSSLIHEMAHWLQRCYDVKGDYHYKWAEYGIYKAVDEMWAKEEEDK